MEVRVQSEKRTSLKEKLAISFLAACTALPALAHDDGFETLEHTIHKSAANKAKLSEKDVLAVAAKELPTGTLGEAGLGSARNVEQDVAIV